MENSDFKNLVNLILKDKAVQYVSIILVIKVLAFSLSLGLTTGFILVAAFFVGFFAFQSLFKQRHEMDNLLGLLMGMDRETGTANNMRMPCSVCGDGTCDRERVVHNKKPWTGLMVPKDVDNAVSDLLQKTLDEFVTSWLKEITSDNSFQQELKQLVRHAASVVLSRALKVDIAKLLTTKGLRVLVRHMAAMQQVTAGRQLQIHPAVTSREAELDYLRGLTTQLLPLLLTRTHFNCKVFEVLVREILAGWLLLPISDTVCDPVVLNSLLLLLMGRQPLTDYPPGDGTNQVEFLAHFVTKSQPSTNASALRPDMCIILKDQSLLYAFMQFLKSQGAVYILQFCLDVEEFNRRMLTPELSSEDLDVLYRDAWDLYSVYFSPHSPDTLNFPDQLVTQMRKVLSKDVTKLRTSPPLFQAYEHAYNLLDSVYCPQFHTSDDFYSWLCGPKVLSNSSKSGSSSPSLPGSPAKSRGGRKTADSLGAVSRLSSRLNKLKGALKASPVTDGQTCDVDTSSLELQTDTDFAEALQYEAERDLSAWRVSILNTFSRVDPTTTKVTTMFTINIQRIDVTQGDSSQWTVERRLTDFYSLDAKLTEFHGEFPDAQLPSRRTIANCTSPSGRPESVQIYEEYLQKLLSKPALRGSDLLFSFLACPGEFVAEDSALGRLLRRGVPLSLRKERGQHLEPFIATFIASTESRVRHSKIEYKDMSQEMSPRHIRKITSPVFGDNFGLHLPPELPEKPSKSTQTPFTPTHCCIYFGVNVLQWSQTTIKFAIALQKLFGNTVDAILQYWLNAKLKRLLVPQRVAHLVKLLQWAIFESRGKSDRAQVARAVELQLREKGEWTRPIYQGMFVAAQAPLLNKQLFYCLLDVLVEELFPEINENEDMKKTE
ncbi:sorting nexin-14-like isoform X1 [Homalodisca vitripennis]|uniref:sorting nexin-14-like isoform X1 n=1 Tax=Homalodisca vitripennis TaxID=197043 RepID=UPI001EEC8B63|nr:sorting nexin-14-like isoform X1 [Homalodisca vitripennis]XP_046688081.1 sorting nexin-14-like isoform X1 [Homalodisca vitripennis]